MDRLWAPWRAQYVRGSPGPVDAAAECFLCRALTQDGDRDNLLVWRGDESVVVLNRFPYNNGHLLIAPRAHLATLEALDGRRLTEPVETMRWMVRLLDRMLRPQGYNIGLNQGKAAGAGLPGHLHWHVVPRWDGDANFMPVLGHTKVIVESLLEFYDRLKAAVDADRAGTTAAPPASNSVSP
jgi:ATP adenylyltransferase